MCLELRMPDGRIIASQGALAAVVGGPENIPFDPDYGRPHAVFPDDEGACLCPIALERLAAAQGWQLDCESDPLYVQVIA